MDALFITILVVAVAYLSATLALFLVAGVVKSFELLEDGYFRMVYLMKSEESILEALTGLCAKAALGGFAVASFLGVTEGTLMYVVLGAGFFVFFTAAELAFKAELAGRKLMARKLGEARAARKARATRRHRP